MFTPRMQVRAILAWMLFLRITLSTALFIWAESSLPQSMFPLLAGTGEESSAQKVQWWAAPPKNQSDPPRQKSTEPGEEGRFLAEQGPFQRIGTPTPLGSNKFDIPSVRYCSNIHAGYGMLPAECMAAMRLLICMQCSACCRSHLTCHTSCYSFNWRCTELVLE